ncbi:Uncharacterised protein [Blautia hydrogenotrophica]|uniref:hypothetical protein n=1 Tax=Blautia hydrogenotrophica TaxID=53443 RepID=UPI0006C4A879|nr:hypothetical protein [Blautia hydrogenotrophica]CUN18532.1 Uncharacterised protein [Blautia hydrogenotrophica]SCH76172.1 Uncharacterised protein [uncultured Blautia sp.]
MAGKELTLEDFMSFIDTLPYNDFRKVVKAIPKIQTLTLKMIWKSLLCLILIRDYRNWA